MPSPKMPRLPMPTSRLKVDVDKITFGLKIDDLDKAKVKRIISQNAKDLVSTEGSYPATIKGKGFLKRFRLAIEGDEKLLVEYHPTKGRFEKVFGFRCEYNPNKLTKAGKRKARSLVAEILGGAYPSLSKRFVIISIDYCIDVIGVSVRDVVFHSSHKQTALTWGKTFGKDAELETLQLGKSSGGRIAKAYDKSREILSAEASRTNTTLKDLEHLSKKLGKRMRIETRLKPRAPFHLWEVEGLGNPFEGIDLYALPSEQGIFNSDMGRLFRAALMIDGVDMALRRIKDKTVARKFKQAVAEHRVEWWNPREFDDAMLEAIKLTGMFEDAAFLPPPLRPGK